MTYWILLLLCFVIYLLPCLPIKILQGNFKGRITNVLVFFGLLFHAGLIYQTTFLSGIDLNFANSLLITSWIGVLLYLLINASDQHKGFEYLTLVPALFFLIVNPFMSGHNYLNETFSALAILHIIFALLGYSLLAFGALFSIFLLYVEQNVRIKKLNTEIFTSSTPILNLEHFLFRIYWLGFVLLTITLISGSFFSDEIFQTPLIINHKLIFSICAWLIYTILLLGRILFGWRGKKAIKFSLIAFIFLFLAYFGSKFVVEILLP